MLSRDGIVVIKFTRSGKLPCHFFHLTAGKTAIVSTKSTRHSEPLNSSVTPMVAPPRVPAGERAAVHGHGQRTLCHSPVFDAMLLLGMVVLPYFAIGV